MPSRKASPGAVTPVKSVVFHRTTQLTTVDTVALASWRPPQAIQVMGFSARARAKGGTHVATVLNLIAGGAVTVATLDIGAVAAGVRAEAASILSELVAADAEVTVDFVETGGTTPTLDDVSFQIDYIERY